ncbi:uncharacterized protein FOMMEDRAFT_90275 [Fomitiporia mediterranea MF3/22]|uniref:uncharacterized protein n=1 Tax=Fomitiporia mediterranea (strain MF3/22) TaxID=694068 RepID=UPI00044086B7|nr:uncharacterized protein FOMMEDRAFT_90275 [Fomitiporia mediterranea MF3/22]EJD01433.1 hypothetical protein FOMMEDRAFT_90275 [Fomitiporia mediterranea MF3/22]
MARKYSTSDVPANEEVTEQTLESHEVVELQAFVRHREWIEDKIKYLESLPPIDIFAGVQELEKTYDQITTLPTRAQLDEWIAEHDRIDKETEILDTGDLKKLKAVTRAATQRNLSPEDTDLIEITLTTLFALDKLLHLLRDRSEQLDLFGSRLNWEEQRALAYSTRVDLISQIQSFLNNRARWKADIYVSKDVLVSDTSGSSSTAPPNEQPDPFSRSARFKLAEEISREVVQHSSKISSLRHGPVLRSGKALDKLIDDSRKPVPEPMLDEQDRVEEKCEKDLAAVGKFLMTVNMQWRKADEVYVETRKDLAALETLSNEVKEALTRHPSRGNEVSFTGRIEAIKKRLQSRMDQTLPSALPMPKHPLFPDQVSFNVELVSTLTSELDRAQSSLSKVNQSISSYRTACDTLEEAEKLRKAILELGEESRTITERLQNGVDSDDSNGLPPDLTQNSCVEPVQFSTFLAVLPSLSSRSAELEEAASKLVKRARMSSLRLDRPGIDGEYKHAFVKDIEDLESRIHNMARVRNDVSRSASRLREVRRVWSAMDGVTKSLDNITPDITEALLHNRWKQQVGGESAPPTPESPKSELPAASATPELINERIVSAKERLEKDVIEPFIALGNEIPAPLHDFIYARQISIERSIFDLQSMNRLLADVRGQTYAMETIREEVHTLEGRIEDSKIQYDDHYESMLRSVESGSEQLLSAPAENEDEQINAKGQALSRNVDSVQTDVNSLVDSLPTRVPLISRHSSSSTEANHSSRSRATFVARLPFDPSTVDRSVRNDTNAYAMRLTGGVKSLQQKRSFSAFYRAARDMNKRALLVQKDIRSLNEQLEQHARDLEELADAPLDGTEDGLSALAALKESLESIDNAEAARLRSSIAALRNDVSSMEGVPSVQEEHNTRDVLSSRLRTLDDIVSHSERIFDRLELLKASVVRAEQAEHVRIAEIARLEKEAAEEELRKEAQRREEEEREAARRVQERFEEEASFSLVDESTPKRDMRHPGFSIEDDVFGHGSPSRQMDKETAELLALIRSLRKQLKSIGLNSVVRPSGASHRRSSSANLPPPEIAEGMAADFQSLEMEAGKLPTSAENSTADTELRSLRLEIEASRELLSRVKQLSRMQASVVLCDTTFSTFLDFIDSYPNCPKPIDGTDVDSPELDVYETPEERLSAKMSHAKGVFSDMTEHFAPVADDPRAIAEHSRLKQTWEELMEMAQEKINGLASRAGSVTPYNSSGRNSVASSRSGNASDGKRSRYSNLSISGRDGLLAPSTLKGRRATSASSAGSGSVKPSQQHSSRPGLPVPKIGSARSVSGPMKQTTPTATSRPSFSLFNSTFASRQRTSSVSSNTSSIASVSRIPSGSRIPAPVTTRRRMSSTLSEISRPTTPAMSTTSSRGTWSRAPRQSFSSFPRASTPERTPRKPRQKYVANPKNKLDMALGDVINNLPVDINVEAVTDTWKDKSGKYWIGGNEPKLCFCRILRSQTVMVRVGGGWTELSKFIKDHFSDLFRMLPETPPRPGSSSKKEKWISAASLRNAEDANSSGSPDSITRNLPSFAFSTPDGTQKSGSPISSPLTPIQFIRRADPEASEISLASIGFSNDLSTSGITGISLSGAAASLRPKRRMSSTSSAKIAWRP